MDVWFISYEYLCVTKYISREHRDYRSSLDRFHLRNHLLVRSSLINNHGFKCGPPETADGSFV